MIALALDLSELRATTLSRRVETDYAPRSSQVELHVPDRVVASHRDPVGEWTDAAAKTQVSISRPSLPLLDLAWTRDHEKEFLELAGQEATGELAAEKKRELERLSGLRRALKNPRRGEELIWEYEQRQLTRDLIVALDRYVTFHTPPSRSKSSAA